MPKTQDLLADATPVGDVVAIALYMWGPNPNASQLSARWLTKLMGENQVATRSLAAKLLQSPSDDNEEVSNIRSSADSALSQSGGYHVSLFAESIQTQVDSAEQPSPLAALQRIGNLVDITQDSVKSFPLWREIPDMVQNVFLSLATAISNIASQAGVGSSVSREVFSHYLFLLLFFGNFKSDVSPLAVVGLLALQMFSVFSICLSCFKGHLFCNREIECDEPYHCFWYCFLVIVAFLEMAIAEIYRISLFSRWKGVQSIGGETTNQGMKQSITFP